MSFTDYFQAADDADSMKTVKIHDSDSETCSTCFSTSASVVSSVSKLLLNGVVMFA